MNKIVDARGLACPQPVIVTRKALQENAEVTTIVDNETSQHNVTKMAQKMGATVETEQKTDGMYLHITKGANQQPADQHSVPTSAGTAGPIVIVAPDQIMGRGDAELGGILIRAFFHTLHEVSPLPDTVIFFNSGVHLVVEGSKIVEDLQALHAQGVEILACGTCLGHYGLKEKLAAGEISNMYTIAEKLLNAGKIVTL